MSHQLRALPVASPAAGAGFTKTLSTEQRGKLRALAFTFTTSAVVANRVVMVQLVDPSANVAFQADAGAVQAAGVAVAYQVCDAYGTPFASAGASGIGWPDVWLPPGWAVKVSAALEDVGDQFSGIVALAEFGWPEWERDNLLAAFAQAG